jgi:hypothetical protein
MLALFPDDFLDTLEMAFDLVGPEEALRVDCVVERRRDGDAVDGVADPPSHQWGEGDRARDHGARAAERRVVGVHVAQMNLALVPRRGLRHATIALVIDIDTGSSRRELHRDRGALEPTSENSHTHARARL